MTLILITKEKSPEIWLLDWRATDGLEQKQHDSNADALQLRLFSN